MSNNPCAAVQADGATQTETEVINCNPPAAIKQLINELFANHAGDILRAQQIPPAALTALNNFGASIRNSEDFEVFAIYDCQTCYVDGAPGRFIETNGRMHCWQC